MRGALLMLALLMPATAQAQEAPPQVVIVQEKNPVVAGVFSALIPGAGQAYNGEWSKAATFFGSEMVLLWATTSTESADGCRIRNECQSANIFSVALFGAWVWGIVDGARSAKRLNSAARSRIQPTASAGGRAGLRVSVPVP